MRQWILAISMAMLFLGAGIYSVWYDAQNEKTHYIFAFAMVQPLLILILALFIWRSVNLSGGRISYVNSFRANGLVYLGMWLLPARMSELIKPLYFKRSNNLSQQLGWSLVLKERVWDLVGFACLCLFILAFILDRALNDELILRVFMLSGAALAVFIGFIILPRLTQRLPFSEKFGEFADTLRSSDRKEHFIQAITTCLIWSFSALHLCIFYSNSGLPQLPIIDLMFIFMVSSLGLVITVTPAGLGTYEAALVAVLGGYDISIQDGIAFAICFRLSWMLLPSLIGLWVVMQEGIDALRIKQGYK